MTSTSIRHEILEVLNMRRNRYLFDPRFDAAEWLDLVEFAAADVVEDTLGPRISADPEDDMFCRAAFTGAATHIVSKDHRRAQVFDPAAFLAAWRVNAGR